MMTQATSHIKRILIVDDEALIANVLAVTLSKLGEEYVVETAVTPQDALERVHHQVYDVVLTDYLMPHMNGLELSQNIRQIAPHTPIILMTAHATEDLRHLTEKMHLDGYIHKPANIATFRKVVLKALEKTTPQTNPIAHAMESLGRLESHLQSLCQQTNAQCVLLLRAEGQVMAHSGGPANLDLASIGALISANFMTAATLGQLLGHAESIFKSSYLEGHHRHVYTHMVNESTLLAVIFGAEAKMGVVRFYTHQTAVALLSLIQPPAPTVPFSFQAFPPQQLMEEEVDRLIDQELAIFFASNQAESNH